MTTFMTTAHSEMYISSWMKEICADFQGFLSRLRHRDDSINADISIEQWTIYDDKINEHLPIGLYINKYSHLIHITQKYKETENRYDKAFGIFMQKKDFEDFKVVLNNLNRDIEEISSFDEGYCNKMTEEFNDLQVRFESCSNDSDKDNLYLEIQGYFKKYRVILTQLMEIEYAKFDDIRNKLHHCFDLIPNLLDTLVPSGKNEDDNLEIGIFGEKPIFTFTPLQHFEVAEKSMDFKSAVETSGSRFAFLYGDLAKLARALENFMLDFLSQYSYTEVVCPQLVKDVAMYGVGQLPKMSDESFVVDGKYRLIPTSEVPLTNLVIGQTLKMDDLPLRYCAVSECFRSEVGSAGRDIQGMIRMHQFRKVEIVSIVSQNESIKEHERMKTIVQEMLRQLGLHYRIVLLCSGDTGFASRKTYDFEVWLPGQNRYREIASCSNFGDFHARRMSARYMHSDIDDVEKGREDLDNGNMGEKSLYGSKRYLHTLNSSALPIGRTLIAILENYQVDSKKNHDGFSLVKLPKVLESYFGSSEFLC